jgi:hypothetical protein
MVVYINIVFLRKIEELEYRGEEIAQSRLAWNEESSQESVKKKDPVFREGFHGKLNHVNNN